ncbi:Transcriptional regulator, tetR family [Cupriavidus taiwanensis]|uniref:TetR family transcriptional regulator n=1 Tax=Cupriavidus taiwanensis TaxID=164546 RepID=UPI000E16AA50|nr:TetR family transcriptional regulator [Cupriavidus taiwanensis]SOZ24669.1 Transcriptional regulator, tetR family [Cupriavidus taiwanensis]
MATRKSAEVRAKELNLAILRIEHGKARTKPHRLSICAVAAEVGVSPALIHNHYPDIAKDINNRPGSPGVAKHERAESELEKERRKNADLRKELSDIRARLTKVTTINEMLITQNKELKARLQSTNIIDMPKKPR